MTPANLLILYAAIIVAASLAGGLVPSLLKLGHRSLQFVLSFVAGVMLGVGFFHMLPHAVMLRAEEVLEHGGEVGHSALDPIMLWTVLGFLALFLLERFSHFHHHESNGHAHTGDHGHEHEHAAPTKGSVGWVGALAGLGIHSLFEGVAMAASVAAGALHGGEEGGALAGLATFLVIVLHKPFDSMTLATLMRRGHAPLGLRVIANVFLALLVPAGIGLFWMSEATEGVSQVAPIALAFSAGMFVCIASSDLLPELQFHRHDRVGLSIALVVGLSFAYVLGRFEASTHVHGGAAPHQSDH